jgi:archaellum component FlaC
MDNQIKPTRDKIFSFSLALLACSITYFAYSILSISQQIPSILAQISDINKQINRTVDEIEPLLVLVPDILLTVDNTTKSILPILNEISKIRELVPQALKEVEAVRSTLPSILERVDDTNQQVEKIIPLIPEVLSEVEKTRNEIPSYLTRVEHIVANAKDISEDAGKGAVTGFFKGIIATPFELIKGTEERIRSSLTNEEMITDEDFKLVSKAVGELLESDQVETIAWENPSSGNKGQITLVNSYQREERECRALLLLFKAKDGSEDSVNRDVCLNDNGKWEALE